MIPDTWLGKVGSGGSTDYGKTPKGKSEDDQNYSCFIDFLDWPKTTKDHMGGGYLIDVVFLSLSISYT